MSVVTSLIIRSANQQTSSVVECGYTGRVELGTVRKDRWREGFQFSFFDAG